MTYVAYVETMNGGGKDATFDTAAAAWEWVRERLSQGSYHTGDVTEADTGNSVPDPQADQAMTTYPNTTLVILAGNCEGHGEAFRDWVAQKHPEIDVDFRARESGVGGGHYDEDGEKIDSRLWEEFCNSN